MTVTQSEGRLPPGQERGGGRGWAATPATASVVGRLGGGRGRGDRLGGGGLDVIDTAVAAVGDVATVAGVEALALLPLGVVDQWLDWGGLVEVGGGHVIQGHGHAVAAGI